MHRAVLSNKGDRGNKERVPPFSPVQSTRLPYANGIWLADLDADAWKLKVHHGFLQPFGTVGSLALFTPPRDEAGREKSGRRS
jgi:hypothetical protein